MTSYLSLYHLSIYVSYLSTYLSNILIYQVIITLWVLANINKVGENILLISIPLCGYNIICSSIHLLKDIWFVSSLGLRLFETAHEENEKPSQRLGKYIYVSMYLYLYVHVCVCACIYMYLTEDLNMEYIKKYYNFKYNKFIMRRQPR